jgi:hypothetical protein
VSGTEGAHDAASGLAAHRLVLRPLAAGAACHRIAHLGPREGGAEHGGGHLRASAPRGASLTMLGRGRALSAVCRAACRGFAIRLEASCAIVCKNTLARFPPSSCFATFSARMPPRPAHWQRPRVAAARAQGGRRCHAALSVVILLAQLAVYSSFDACVVNCARCARRWRCAVNFAAGVRLIALRGGGNPDIGMLPQSGAFVAMNNQKEDADFTLGRVRGVGSAVDGETERAGGSEYAERAVIIPDDLPSLQLALWRDAERGSAEEAIGVEGSAEVPAARDRWTTYKVVSSVNPNQPMAPAAPGFCLRIRTWCHIQCLPGVSIHEGPVKLLGNSRGSFACAKLFQLLNYTLVIQGSPWVMENCEVRNIGGAAVRMEGSGEARFVECAVGGPGPGDERTRDGFWLLDQSALTLDSSRVEYTSFVGIVCWQDSVCRVNGCWLQHGQTALDLNDRALAHVCGCRIENVVHGAFWAKLPGNCQPMTQLVALDNHIQGNMWWGEGRPAKVQDDGNVVSAVHTAGDGDALEDARDLHIRAVQVCTPYIPGAPSPKEPVIAQGRLGDSPGVMDEERGAALAADMWNFPVSTLANAVEVVAESDMNFAEAGKEGSEAAEAMATTEALGLGRRGGAAKAKGWYHHEELHKRGRRRGAKKQHDDKGEAGSEGSAGACGTWPSRGDGGEANGKQAYRVPDSQNSGGMVAPTPAAGRGRRVGRPPRRAGRVRGTDGVEHQRSNRKRRRGGGGNAAMVNESGCAPEMGKGEQGAAGMEGPRPRAAPDESGRVKTESLLQEQMAAAGPKSLDGAERDIGTFGGLGILNCRRRAWMDDYGDLPPQLKVCKCACMSASSNF